MRYLIYRRSHFLAKNILKAIRKYLLFICPNVNYTINRAGLFTRNNQLRVLLNTILPTLTSLTRIPYHVLPTLLQL